MPMRRNVCAAIVFAVIAGAFSSGTDPTTTTTSNATVVSP